jgi:hypothetical protein
MEHLITMLLPDCGYLIQQQLLRQKRRDEIVQVLREMLPDILAEYGTSLNAWNAPFPEIRNRW